MVLKFETGLVPRIAEKLNNFFKEAVSTFDVNENSYIINPDFIKTSDPIGKAISE